MTFKCPYCNNEAPPIVTKEMSTGGWVLFIVLLLFCLPLCWLPFVLDGCKEEKRKCSSCGTKLG
jgi:lipopolysaccharide-induced tumor necrosis factor-alpha factor